MNKNAFTLIELLIVISIISVLSGISLIIYSKVQIKTRDSLRKSDLQQLSLALEGYFQQNGKYILPASNAAASCTRDTAKFYSEIANFIKDNNVPKDPKDKTQYCYVSENSGQSFRLFARLENCQDPEVIDAGLCPTTSYNYSRVSDDLDNLSVKSIPGGVASSPKRPPCSNKGDINNDGFVTDADQVEGIRILSGESTLSDGTPVTNDHRTRADVDGNGDVTIVDILHISRYISGEIFTFPVCL